MKTARWLAAVLLTNFIAIAGVASARDTAPTSIAPDRAAFSEGQRCPLCDVRPAR